MPPHFDESLLAEPCCTAEPHVRLRAVTQADAEAIAAGLGQRDVARMLAQVPHPYTLADAEKWLAGPARDKDILRAGIEVEGAFAGLASIRFTERGGELGYWVAKPHWGRGAGTAAIRALVGLAFAATTTDKIEAAHMVDNPASGRVLEKLGFSTAGSMHAFSRGRGETVLHTIRRLTRENWAASQPRIETPRLLLRPPLMADSAELAALANDPTVGRMTASIPYPYTHSDARAFILRRSREQRPASLTFSVRDKATGALAGGVGWRAVEPGVLELGYWLGAPFRGRGVATEAARAALEAAFAMTQAEAVKATCKVSNLASRRVLERCGFQWDGAGLLRASTGAGSVAVDRFRLDRATFASLRAWAPSEVSHAFA